jgi:hypothetical protein
MNPSILLRCLSVGSPLSSLFVVRSDGLVQQAFIFAPLTNRQSSAVGYVLASALATWGATHIRQRHSATGQSA